MVKVRAGLEKVKEDYRHVVPPEAILQMCQVHEHRFRQRILGPVETVYLFLIQILHGNAACSGLRHLAGMACSVNAYCQAKARLPLAVFRALLHWVCQSLRDVTDAARLWHGHRVFHVDGSSFSMPDTPELQGAFGQPGGQKAGCGFPVARLLAMFDAATGMILDVLASPLRTHEMSQVSSMHPSLRPGDVLVGDRGFCSYVHLALLSLRRMHAVFRIHQRILVDFRPGRRHAPPGVRKSPKGLPRSKWLRAVGVQDQIVEWYRPRSRPTWMTREQFERLPESLTLRELSYRIETPGYRTREIALVTTLLDPHQYPAEDLAELYRCRWQVEVNLRHLKQTMGMDVMRCKSPEGVLKEMLMFAMVYNLVCAVAYDAAAQQGVPPDRISFIDALRWLRTWEPGINLITLIVNPRRPGRFEPRVVKRRSKQYKLMTEPRTVLRKRLLEQKDAA
ncbi:MAG TPA: IS4 family transposase [Phycisphaerae bacterium]|nr:IS4 family transposase [Phycisphaerae bacterium]